MSQLKPREQIHPSSAFLFYLGPPWITSCPLTLERAICFTHQFQRSSLPETPSQANPAVMPRQLSQQPLAQSSHHVKLTITSRIPFQCSLHSLRLLLTFYTEPEGAEV